MTTVVLAGVVFLLVVGGVIALVVRAVRGRDKQDEDGGLDLIPYLLLALFVGAAGFSLAALARASLTPDRLIGRPTGELAGALAGLVVAAPIAYFLGRRQARRRKAFPETPGWPVYLAIIELVFLTAFLAALAQVAGFLSGDGDRADWTDLVIYGGIVVLHWWAERRERPMGDIGDLPRLVGSGVALVALTIGLIGTLEWLFSVAYDSSIGTGRRSGPGSRHRTGRGRSGDMGLAMAPGLGREAQCPAELLCRVRDRVLPDHGHRSRGQHDCHTAHIRVR